MRCFCYLCTMESFLATLLVTVVVFAFFAASLGIKMFFDSKAEFKGGCGSRNPMLVNDIGECTVCGMQTKGKDDCDVSDNDSQLPSIETKKL